MSPCQKVKARDGHIYGCILNEGHKPPCEPTDACIVDVCSDRTGSRREQ